MPSSKSWQSLHHTMSGRSHVGWCDVVGEFVEMCWVVNSQGKVRRYRGLDEVLKDLEDLIMSQTVPLKYHCNLAVAEDMDERLLGGGGDIFISMCTYIKMRSGENRGQLSSQSPGTTIQRYKTETTET